MNPPIAVVLAGGEGKRFAPLITNKTIFPFLGKPLLVHLLEQLKRVGFQAVILITSDDNHSLLESIRIEGLSLTQQQQTNGAGMSAALLSAEHLIGDAPFIVMNAVDVVDDRLFSSLLDHIEHHLPYAVITAKKVTEYFPGGYLQLEGNKIKKIIEKPGKGNEPSDLVNLVFHYFSRPSKLFSILKNAPAEADDAYEQALSSLFQEHDVDCITYDSYWSKLKYPHFVLDVMEMFLEHRLQPFIHPTAAVSPGAFIDHNVYIDEGAVIDSTAVIKGPSYIGKNVRVSTGSLIRNSLIEANTVTGFGTEIARSYIGPSCSLHHNFIGDSVLEANVNPSYGTVTTNLRFDGAPIDLKLPTEKIATNRTKLGAVLANGVFSGAHTVYLPGVTVGARSVVYPLTTVHAAVPADTTIKSYQQQEERETT